MRRRCSARARAASCVAGDPAELGRLADRGVDLFVIGSAGGDRISIAAAEAELEIELADAERAWRSLPDLVEDPAALV